MSSRREWLVILKRALRTPRGYIGLTVAGLVVLIAIFGPWLAPHNPTQTVTETFGTPGGGNGLLGGDAIGRDVFSRVLAGGRTLLGVAAAATLLGVVIGVLLGVTAAYVGTWKDGLIMRVEAAQAAIDAGAASTVACSGYRRAATRERCATLLC